MNRFEKLPFALMLMMTSRKTDLVIFITVFFAVTKANNFMLLLTTLLT